MSSVLAAQRASRRPRRTRRVPAVGIDQPKDAASERALARSRLADDREHLAGRRPRERRLRRRGAASALRDESPTARGTASRVPPTRRSGRSSERRSGRRFDGGHGAHALRLPPADAPDRAGPRLRRPGRIRQPARDVVVVRLGGERRDAVALGHARTGIAGRTGSRAGDPRRSGTRPSITRSAPRSCPARGQRGEERLRVGVTRRAEDRRRRARPRRAGPRTSRRRGRRAARPRRGRA